MNETTKKYARTMQEAFGPYTTNDIWEEQDVFQTEDKIVMWAITICGIACFFIIAIWG